MASSNFSCQIHELNFEFFRVDQRKNKAQAKRMRQY